MRSMTRAPTISPAATPSRKTVTHQREAVTVGLQQHADQPIPDDLQRHDQEAADEDQQRRSAYDAVRRPEPPIFWRAPRPVRSRPATASNRPPTATIRLIAAPTWTALSKPTVPIRYQPPKKAPTPRPVYSARRASDEAGRAGDLADDRLGKERQRASHQKVGHSRPANTMAKITARDSASGSSSR